MSNIGCDSRKYICDNQKHIYDNGKKIYGGTGYVCERDRKIPVRAEVDVIVAGGGLAGVAAAVAAAKQ